MEIGAGIVKEGIDAISDFIGEALGNAVKETAMGAVGAEPILAGGEAAIDAAKDGSESKSSEQSAPKDASPELERSGKKMRSANLAEWKALGRVVAARRGYRDASAAGDAKGMQTSLRNVVIGAMQLRDVSRQRAQARFEFELQAETATDQKIADMEKNGVHLQDAVAKWQQDVKQNGLPPALVEMLKSRGVSADKVDAIRQEIINATPAQFQQALDARRARLQIDQAMRSNLQAAQSKANWPEPRELNDIGIIMNDARAALEQVSQTRIDLSPPAGVAPEKLPKWWAVPSGSALGTSLDAARLQAAASSGPLMPGSYDIYTDQAAGNAGQPLPSAVRLAKGVVVAKGHPTTMPLNTGITLQLPKGLPAPYSWFVLPADSNSTIPLAGRADASADPLLLPAGKYDVYWVQTQSQLGRPVLMASGIDVKAGAMTTVPMSSASINLDVGAWVPARDPNYGGWGAVRAGDPPKFAIRATAKDMTLVIPPGQYDVYWMQDYDHAPFLLASGVDAKENDKAIVAASAGITLESAAWVPARDATYGRWGVVLAGTQPPIKEFINWSKKDNRLLLRPGTYDVYWVQDYDHDPFLLAGAVEVKPNAHATVAASAGITLESAAWVPARDATYGRWGVVLAGTQPPIKEFINWAKKDGTLLVPAGHYDVYWVDRYDRGPFLVTADVDATGAKPVNVKAATGIRLKVPPTTPAMNKDYGFWGVTPSGQEAGVPNIRSAGRFDLPLLVPPWDV